MRAMWAHRHALLATGDDNITLSGHDLLCCECDSTQAGPADLIDTECGLGIWNSGYARGLTGGILTRSGRQYLAEDDFVDVAGCQACPLDGRSDSHFT